ncbi:MAG TPA: cytochrome P450 [Jatrophihabitantaceae bacterium]|nr:cytochrome P450 [Jatrophihabitantaceae bacterium]
MTRARTWLTWFIRYGIPGFAIRTAARRGDLIARSAVDRAAVENPAALYDELRALGPVGGNKLVGASAHHAVVNEILRSDAFFANPGGAPTKTLDRILTRAIDPRALGPVDIPSLLAIHPPQHARIRRLVTHAFTPKAIAGYTETIRAIANELLDRAEAKGGEFDLVADYATPLPVKVIADIIGIPAESHNDVLRVSNEAALTLDPALSWRQFRSADAAIREANVMLDDHIADLRRNPGDDLLSELVRITDNGERLSDEELRVNTLLLLGAGFETTVNLIGNAVALLTDHRDQLEVLQSDPSGWPNAVDEVLRYDSPVQVTIRVANRETEVAGVPVPEGRAFVLMLGAANRDPEVFADAGRFDVTRADARLHLAFSAGIHYCLGAQLARLEAAIALETLFDRFPDLAIAGTPVRRSTRVLHGFEHLPVTSVPATVLG